MSLTLEIHLGAERRSWPLSPTVLRQLQRLADSGHRSDVARLVGPPDAEPGATRTLTRTHLLSALDRLQPATQELPRGFQVRMNNPYGGNQQIASRAVSGVMIDGVHYTIDCSDNDWNLKPAGHIPEGKRVPPHMRGEPRTEPALIQSENCGTVHIERKKGKQPELGRLLSQIRAFVASTDAESIAIVVA